MTARKTYMDQIIRELAIAQTEMEYQCGLGIYDDVHYWEEIARGLLNGCYGFHLVNLNEEKKNFPGIDLGDRERGIGVQVTAERGSTKLNDTIQTMIGKRVYEEFPHLLFFILGRKQNKYTVTQNGQAFLDFDAKKDILDFGDIMEKCQTLELEALKKVAGFLTGEISQGETLGIGNAEKEEAYRKHLLSCTDSISIIGMAKKLPIEMAWIQLRLMDEEALRELKEKGTGRMPYKEEIRRTGRKFDMESIWTSAENMVILAAPGAGKSTLLKKLVQTAVRQEQKVIWLPLMDVAGLLKQGKTFDQAMRGAMTVSLSFEVSKTEFEYRLRYLFLDGLDECGSIRRKIAAEIERWAAVHPWVSVVVTSRPLGYDIAALSDFRHMAILPMDFEECKSYVRELLEKLVPGDAEQCADWFEEHTKNRNIVELVSKSPLLLGFLLQLSIKRIDFGNSRIELYGRVMQEWLQGSSRQNERKISEAGLMYGIEAVAYYMMNAMDRVHEGAWEKEKILSTVTPWLQRELNSSKLAARQNAEYILEFWDERGILEKNYLESGIQYRFIHLNIGEYLAGKYISEMEPGGAEKWVLARSGSAKWHETIRMAVACDDSGSLAASLRKHEEAAKLPTGEIFLAAEGTDEKTLLKGIAAYSEIVALPCMNMLVQREGKEETKQALLVMLYAENEDVIERIGMIAPYIWKEKSAEIILDRLLHENLDVCAGLYRVFPESYGKFRTKDWTEAMRRGVSNNNSELAKNACTCTRRGLQQGYLDGDAKEELLSFCKEQFEIWLRRKVKCVNCDAGAYLDERGFCPECHVGGNLPYRAFMELLIDNRRLDYQELIRYGGHPSSDISGAAWEGMQSFWEENPQSIGEILEQIKEDQCPKYLFGWLLAMPDNVIAGYQRQIVDVAEKENRELQLVFLEKMNGLEWLPVKVKREYLKKMMCSADAEVKARATKVWLILE